MPKIGIGIITYNRVELLTETIEQVRRFTRDPDACLVVADDGSSDGTPAMLRQQQVPVVTGVNMGIAWNKNRALFLLAHGLGCETVILLEDDAQPVEAGWEAAWEEAAQRWGHVNYAGDWMRQHFIYGTGTLEDPARGPLVTAQCSAYSRTSLTYGGYFDPRFKGYGHEHVEHTARLRRIGFGGTYEPHDGGFRILFYMIKGGVDVRASRSHHNQADAERNLTMAQQLMSQENYRAPWGDDRELRQFKAEMDSALSLGTERFRIRTDPRSGQHAAGRGLFSRLFTGLPSVPAD